MTTSANGTIVKIMPDFCGDFMGLPFKELFPVRAVCKATSLLTELSVCRIYFTFI